MVRSIPIAPRRAGERNCAASNATFDVKFNTGWAARGRVHEGRMRLRFVSCAAALAVGAAIGYALFRL
jgi:hypothetical protein